MIVPDHAVAVLIERAVELRQENKKGKDTPVVVEARFEPDWPAQALTQLANRLREHYIDLEATMVSREGR